MGRSTSREIINIYCVWHFLGEKRATNINVITDDCLLKASVRASLYEHNFIHAFIISLLHLLVLWCVNVLGFMIGKNRKLGKMQCLWNGCLTSTFMSWSGVHILLAIDDISSLSNVSLDWSDWVGLLQFYTRITLYSFTKSETCSFHINRIN